MHIEKSVFNTIYCRGLMLILFIKDLLKNHKIHVSYSITNNRIHDYTLILWTIIKQTVSPFHFETIWSLTWKEYREPFKKYFT